MTVRIFFCLNKEVTYPALVPNVLRTLSTDTDPNNVSGGVEERLAELQQLGVGHDIGEMVDSHGRDERTVVDNGSWQSISISLMSQGWEREFQTYHPSGRPSWHGHQP